MTHPIFTPYYTIPMAMLSLWTLLFVTLMARRAGGGKVGPAAAGQNPEYGVVAPMESLDPALSAMKTAELRVAVLVPCFNEEAAIATVVADFRKALPAAKIFVYDNNSRDRTAEVARAAGAEVRRERRQGKGHVVRRMFADVDADVYVLVDGDATYDAPSAPRMIDRLVNDAPRHGGGLSG